VKFTIPGELPSLNEYIHAINRNRHIGNKMKQDTQEAIQWAIRAQTRRGYEITQPVQIRFLWASRTAKKDIDNVAFAKKFILDAMVTMGVLPNDTRKWVRGFTDEFVIDRENPRTEVEILPYVS
jgi:Holliday junction resolvase RusA-like endonuclease